MDTKRPAQPDRRDTRPPLSGNGLPASVAGVSVLALAAAGVIGAAWPSAVEASPGLVWALALVPVLLWSHARGWRGAAAAAAGGMAALTAFELVFHLWSLPDSVWLVLGTATVVYIPLTVGAGWISEQVTRRVRNRRLYELAPAPMLVHLDERIVYGNLAARELLGVEPGHGVEGRSLLEFVARGERERMRSRLRSFHEPAVPGPADRERYRLVRDDGRERVVEADSTGVLYGQDRAAQTILRDVTALAQLEEELERRALYDALTELPNRHLLEDRLEHALERAQRRPTDLAVLFVDLDRFKEVNDQFGHRTGDRVLARVGRRLKATVRRADTVARYGGDEFAVLLEDLDGPGEARLTARRIVEAFEEPVPVEGRTFPVPVSVGVAFAEDGPGDAEELIARADEAMYEVKEAGGGGLGVYRPGGRGPEVPAGSAPEEGPGPRPGRGGDAEP